MAIRRFSSMFHLIGQSTHASMLIGITLDQALPKSPHLMLGCTFNQTPGLERILGLQPIPVREELVYWTY